MNTKKKSIAKGHFNIEKLSWFSSIFSFLLGVLVWLIPSPQNLLPFLSQLNFLKHMNLWQAVQIFTFSLLVGFVINTIAQTRHKKMKVDEKQAAEKLNIKISYEGSWFEAPLVAGGMMLLAFSALTSLIAVIFEKIWLIIPTLLFFLLGVYALSFLSWDFFDRIKGKFTFTYSELTKELFSKLFKIMFMFILTVTAIIILVIKVSIK